MPRLSPIAAVLDSAKRPCTSQKAIIAQICHVTLLQRVGAATVAPAASKALPELPAAVESACSGTLSKERGQTGALKVRSIVC